MKIYIIWILSCFVFNVTPAISQVNSNDTLFIAVDAYAILTPRAETKSVERLSKYLTSPYQCELEKVRSIYAWIVFNIRYDHALAKSKNRKKVSPQNVLKLRRGVCAGYADLFVAMCTVAGIESQVITGYSRYYNFNIKRPFTWADHGWNAVKIEGIWYLLDATWEEKQQKKTHNQVGQRYFLADPKKFVIDHLPEEPMWQLLDNPIALDDFKSSTDSISFMLKQAKGNFNYYDSIRTRNDMPKHRRELEAARKSYLFNPANNITMGLGLMNYGTYLSKVSVPKTNLDLKLRNQQQALNFYRRAMKHLRKTDRKGYVWICKNNIMSTKVNIRGLNKRIKFASG